MKIKLFAPLNSNFFPQLKEYLADPSKFAVAAAAPVETKSEEKKEVKVEEEEESDDDMGLDLFGQSYTIFNSYSYSEYSFAILD